MPENDIENFVEKGNKFMMLKRIHLMLTIGTISSIVMMNTNFLMMSLLSGLRI